MVLCDGQVVHRTRPLRNTELRPLSFSHLVHRLLPAARLVVTAEATRSQEPDTTRKTCIDVAATHRCGYSYFPCFFPSALLFRCVCLLFSYCLCHPALCFARKLFCRREVNTAPTGLRKTRVSPFFRLRPPRRVEVRQRPSGSWPVAYRPACGLDEHHGSCWVQVLPNKLSIPRRQCADGTGEKRPRDR